jgi:membrane-associated phospholipid phosphatase
MHPLVDLLSVSIVAFFVAPWILLLALGDAKFAWLGVGVFLVDLLTKLVKRATAGCSAAWLKRPPGAKQCDLFCRAGPSAGVPGMPSGHAAVTAFFWTFLFLWRPTWAIGLAGVACVGLVGYARVAKSCHTIEQVGAGAVIGVVSAYLAFSLAR